MWWRNVSSSSLKHNSCTQGPRWVLAITPLTLTELHQRCKSHGGEIKLSAVCLWGEGFVNNGDGGRVQRENSTAISRTESFYSGTVVVQLPGRKERRSFWDKTYTWFWTLVHNPLVSGCESSKPRLQRSVVKTSFTRISRFLMKKIGFLCHESFCFIKPFWYCSAMLHLLNVQSFPPVSVTAWLCKKMDS